MLAALDLAARRGPRLLWQHLNIALDAGEALLVRGANGAGKTTLLRILAGLAHAEHGTVAWRGRTAPPFAPALRDELLFVGHVPALRDELSAAENLASLSSLAAEPLAPPALAAALAAVDLARQAALPARVLSQGQRRRVAARAPRDDGAAAVDPRRADHRARCRRRALARGTRDAASRAAAAWPWCRRTRDIDFAPARVQELTL